MIEESARVVEVAAGRARVQTDRSGSCEQCKARGGCASLGGGREAQVWVDDPLGVQVGDRVQIAVPEGTVIRASVLLYLLPVLALLGGALVGSWIAAWQGWSPDLVAVAVGGAWMAAAFLLARRFGQSRAEGPRIVGRG